jgi:histidinol dehydrogenase
MVREIQPIMEAVSSRGDAALRELTARFDGVELDGLEVSQTEIDQAGDAVSADLKDAIRVAAANIEAFHAPQIQGTQRVETMPGVVCWRRSVPIQRVGLYVPGGTAPLFSTVLMLGIPARLAGCPEVVLCTPPQADGSVHPAVLFAARLVGVHRVFRIGGAQAIAAMTFGTETVPRVDKLFGPGNQYVTAAKQWASLLGRGVDMPAGPTEVAILADASANPGFIAADMLSQAEHGADSQVFVVLTSERLLAPLNDALAAQLADLPRREIAAAALENSVTVIEPDLDTAVDLLNAYAAEHLILSTENASGIATSITNAGSVFVGHLTPESAGDYASGTNHTLPTGGASRAFSGVGVDAFVRKMTFQEITDDGLRKLGPVVETMAKAEELEGHARAVTKRLESLPEASDPHARTGQVSRQTSETDIFVRVNLDGSGRSQIGTGLAFFDHMLTQIARHGGVDLDVQVTGDLEVDEHHTVEDTAIALGAVFRSALGDKRGIQRYAFLLPMDEALAHVALDLGGRSHLVWDVPFTREVVGDVPTEMWAHFFKSFCDAAACNLNIKASGDNDHHVIESVFKGFARCLRDAVRKGPDDSIPSSKGVL